MADQPSQPDEEQAPQSNADERQSVKQDPARTTRLTLLKLSETLKIIASNPDILDTLLYANEQADTILEMTGQLASLKEDLERAQEHNILLHRKIHYLNAHLLYRGVIIRNDQPLPNPPHNVHICNNYLYIFSNPTQNSGDVTGVHIATHTIHSTKTVLIRNSNMHPHFEEAFLNWYNIERPDQP